MGNITRTLSHVERTKDRHYRIERGDRFTGKDKYVVFTKGVGVLDLEAIGIERDDWVEKTETGYVQHKGVFLSEYLEMWRKRRETIVTEISAEEAVEIRAAAYRHRVRERDREQLIAKELQTASRRSKSGGLDRSTRDEIVSKVNQQFEEA